MSIMRCSICEKDIDTDVDGYEFDDDCCTNCLCDNLMDEDEDGWELT